VLTVKSGSRKLETSRGNQHGDKPAVCTNWRGARAPRQAVETRQKSRFRDLLVGPRVESRVVAL